MKDGEFKLMQNEDLKDRWYDKNSRMSEVLSFICDLPENEQEELGITIIKLVNVLRRSRKEDEIPISIGKDRVLGLYKAFNKRRWYDQNSTLMSAMNILKTLPDDDCRSIIEGLVITLNGQNYKIEV
jgi:hypothetical protein